MGRRTTAAQLSEDIYTVTLLPLYKKAFRARDDFKKPGFHFKLSNETFASKYKTWAANIANYSAVAQTT